MNSIKKGFDKLKYLFLTAIIVLLYYGLSQSSLARHYLGNPEALRSLILSFGILAPLLVISLQAFQTAVSIIPSEITTIIAGFAFGPALGLLYSLIGTFIGSALIFLVSRKFGTKIALHLFEKKEMVNFNLFFRQKGLWALFLARVAPLFPNDLVSFTAGLTGIGFWQFSLVSTLGFLAEMIILVFFGAGLMAGQVTASIFFFGVLVGLLVLMYIFKQKIRKIIIKDTRLLEKEGVIIEEAVEKEFKKIEKEFKKI